MQHNKRQNLTVNERKIVELTLQGESQKDIANKLDIAPSTVYRTLRREHIQDMITSATQGMMSSLVQKMLQNYEKAQERVSREIDTMPIQSVIYYMNHVKQAVQHIHIDVAKGESQKLQEAKKGKTVFHIKYNDTDAMFDRQVKNALRKFDIPEEVIEQQNFKYG